MNSISKVFNGNVTHTPQTTLPHDDNMKIFFTDMVWIVSQVFHDMIFKGRNISLDGKRGGFCNFTKVVL